MILFSYTFIVGIITFITAAQADIASDELSLSISNEKVKQYKYEKTIQSATTENGGNRSITTNINTEIAQEIHSTKELDLNDVDSTNLNLALNPDLTDKLNGLDSDSSDIELNDINIMNRYQSSNYYESIRQNIPDLNKIFDDKDYLKSNQNGGAPNTAASSYNSNSPLSNVKPTSPNEDLSSVTSAATNPNGAPSQFYSFMTYPTGSPRDLNIGVSSYPQMSNQNSDNAASNNNQNAGAPTTGASFSNSNGSPYSTFSNSPNNFSPLDQLNGQRFDSNGYMLSDITLAHQSSNQLRYDIQNTDDLKAGIPTTGQSPPNSNSPLLSNVKPASPNEDLSSVTSTATNPNGVPSQSYSSMTYPTGSPRDLNIGVSSYPQMLNQNSDNAAPNNNQNAGAPTTGASFSNSNGSPYSTFSNSPNNVSPLDQLNGQGLDSNGYKSTDNSLLNSNKLLNDYGFIQNTVDQENSYPYLSGKTASPDKFSSSSGIPPTLPGENTKDLPSVGDAGLNTASNTNVSPQTVDQSPTEIEYSSMVSETYGSLNYDMGYELPNTDVGLNRDDNYIFDNYDYINIGRVNNPLSNKNGDVYNDYFNERSTDGDYGTQNDDNMLNGYFENFGFETSNRQESPYDSYVPNINALYENHELQYVINQNAPSFKGSTSTGNDFVPFDTNMDRDNNPHISVTNSDLYNYNSIYDDTNIGIDESSPENELSRTDFSTFSNTQISQTSYSKVSDLYNDANIDIEKVNSNYIGQVDETDLYNAQGFNQYNMQSIGVPGYNQLIEDYTSFSNTETNADINSPEGSYLTPQLLNSEYNFLTGSDLNKQGSNLNKQNSDSNSLLIGNVEFNKNLNLKTDTSNVNNLIEDSAESNSNSFPIKAFDNRLKSIQTTVSSKNNELAGEDVYGAKGQVIGKLYKPSNSSVKINNRHKYSGSSSYSISDDSEFSEDMDAIGNDITRAARDAIGNVKSNIKDAYDTTKAVGKAIGNIVGNAASKAEHGIEKMAKTAYDGSKDAVNAVGNATSKALHGVEQMAKTAYHASKDAVNDVGNAIDDTAKTAYHASKDAIIAVEKAISDATDSIEKTAENFY